MDDCKVVVDGKTSTDLQKRMEEVLSSGKLADLILVVGKESSIKKFSTHRNILAFASKYFESLLYSSKDGMQLEIFLPDEDPKIFEKLLRYIYCDAVPSDLEDVEVLYHLAEKFKISHLKERCIKVMSNQLKQNYPQNVFNVYRFALEAEVLPLMQECAIFATVSTTSLLKSPYLSQCSEKVLQEITKLRSLNIESEASLFRSLLTWSKTKSKCNKKTNSSEYRDMKSTVKRFLPNIRFRSMTIEEFVEGPAACGVFTEYEKDWITNDIRGRDNIYCPYPWYNFNRRVLCPERLVDVSPSVSFYTPTTDFVEHFAAILKPFNEEVVILKIGFESLSLGHSEMKLTVTATDNAITEMDAVVSAYWDGSKNFWMVEMPIPCILRRSVSYEFSLRRTNNRGFKGTFRDIKKCDWNVAYSHKKELHITKISKYIFDYVVMVVL